MIKAILTLAFLAVMVGIGVYSRKHSKSVDGFVLGGRNVGPWLTAFAYGTSYFSAVVFVGYAGQFGWKFGLSSTWIGVGNAIIGSMLAWMVLAKRTRLMTQHIQSRTMPDFFGTRFDSEGLRVVASIIAFVFLIPYTAGVYMGISKLFELGFGSTVPYEAWATLMAVLTAVYVILGGYKATAINDFIQGIIMLFGITAVIFVVLHNQGGFSVAVAKLAEVAADKDPTQCGQFATWFGPDVKSLIGVVILTSLGTWGLPQMVGKFYSITDESAVRRGTIISTVFALVVAGGCYFIGGFGRLFDAPPVLPADYETLREKAAEYDRLSAQFGSVMIRANTDAEEIRAKAKADAEAMLVGVNQELTAARERASAVSENIIETVSGKLSDINANCCDDVILELEDIRTALGTMLTTVRRKYSEIDKKLEYARTEMETTAHSAITAAAAPRTLKDSGSNQ